MDISCDVIRDLLPLYAEDLTSEASNQLVDEHLCQCDPCTKQLAILKKATAMPMDVDTGALKRVGDTIRRRKILTVAASIMTMIALMVTGWIYLFTPYTLTAEEAIEGVELREDGALAIDYARGITGKASKSIFDVDNNAMVCNTTRYDWYEGKKLDVVLEKMTREEIEAYIAQLYDKEECTEKDWNRFFEIDVDYGMFITKDGEYLQQYDPETWTEDNGEWTNRPTDRNQWYINPSNGDVDMLLWDAGLDYPSSILWTTSSAYAFVMCGSLILAVLFYMISRGITGIWQEILSRAVIVLISVAVSTLLITGGHLTTLEYHLTREWNQAIYMETLALSLAVLLWHQLHRLNKQDKGQ